MAARRAKTISISTPRGSKKVYVQPLALWPNGRVSCSNVAILKIGPYLRNRWSYIKNKLNFHAWSRNGVYVEPWQMTKLFLVLKQSVTAHGPLVFFVKGVEGAILNVSL